MLQYNLILSDGETQKIHSRVYEVVLEVLMRKQKCVDIMSQRKSTTKRQLLENASTLFELISSRVMPRSVSLTLSSLLED